MNSSSDIAGDFNNMVLDIIEFHRSNMLDIPLKIVISDLTFDILSNVLQKMYLKNSDNVISYSFEYRGIIFEREHNLKQV